MESYKTPGRGPGEGFPSARVVLILLAAMFVVILIGKLFKEKTLAPSGAASAMGTWTASMPAASRRREPVRVGSSSHASAASGGPLVVARVARLALFRKLRREMFICCQG